MIYKVKNIVRFIDDSEYQGLFEACCVNRNIFGFISSYNLKPLDKSSEFIEIIGIDNNRLLIVKNAPIV